MGNGRSEGKQATKVTRQVTGLLLGKILLDPKVRIDVLKRWEGCGAGQLTRIHKNTHAKTERDGEREAERDGGGEKEERRNGQRRK